VGAGGGGGGVLVVALGGGGIKCSRHCEGDLHMLIVVISVCVKY